MKNLKTLIHLHTDYSYDSNISLDALARFVESEGFGCVAITDHDTIEGALYFRGQTDAKVIVGEEVSTREGHLIGLFLQERIRPGLSALETAKAIREQGGVVLLPHPFVKLFGCGLRSVAYDIVDWIDAVEVNNAQNLLCRPDRAASRFASLMNLPQYVGADSHMTLSIAPCYQFMNDFAGPEDFLESLSCAQLVPGRHSLAFFAATGFRMALNPLGLIAAGAFGRNYHRSSDQATPAFDVMVASAME